MTFDAQTTTFSEVKVRRDPACPACGRSADAEREDAGAEDAGARTASGNLTRP